MKSKEDWMNDNLSGAEGSLVYDLHELGLLNQEKLQEFYSVASLIISDLEAGKAGCISTAKIFMIHTIIWKYLSSHFDSNDGYNINNFTADLYGNLIDEMDEIFDVRKFKGLSDTNKLIT